MHLCPLPKAETDMHGERMFYPLLLLASFTIASCAVEPSKIIDYPVQWPAQQSHTDCAQLRGTFVNEAISSTLQPNGSQTWLLSVLTNGGILSSSPDLAAQAQSEIQFDPDTLTASISEQAGTGARRVNSAGRWRCTATGEIEIAFPAEFQGGEDSLTDRSTTTALLGMAVDGSLIVSLDNKSRGTQFPGVPYRYESRDWLRFARAR